MVDQLGVMLKRTEDYDLQIYAASTLTYLFQQFGFDIHTSDPQTLISVKVIFYCNKIITMIVMLT